MVSISLQLLAEMSGRPQQLSSTFICFAFSGEAVSIDATLSLIEGKLFGVYAKPQCSSPLHALLDGASPVK
jgi:hypothetical protein